MFRLDIGEVSQRSGFSASALRYYEKRGLIASDGRKGLRRQYDDGVLQRLGLIALGQSAGYSLEEIASLLQPEGGSKLGLNRNELRSQAERLRRQARELQATAKMLEHIACCSAPSHMECPEFQARLQEALQTRAE